MLVPLHGVSGKNLQPRSRRHHCRPARGCDVGLDAADVSNLHCVIARTADGCFRLRDCNSRAGTKINGDSVKSTALRDGDVLQVGPFCFTVQIPHSRAEAIQAHEPGRVEHWQKSRSHLARQALRLRKKLIKLMEEGVCQTPSELTRKIADLKERLRVYDHRSTELEEAERELADEHNKLRREREEHSSYVQKIQTDLAGRLKEVDEQIRQKWQEFQQRCRREERLAEVVRGLPKQDARRIQKEADKETLIDQIRQVSLERDKALAELKSQKEQLDQQFQAGRDQAAVALREDRARLEQEREKLLHEQESIRAQMELEEAELARRLDKVEDDIQKRWQEFYECRKQQEEISTMQTHVNGHDFPVPGRTR